MGVRIAQLFGLPFFTKMWNFDPQDGQPHFFSLSGASFYSEGNFPLNSTSLKPEGGNNPTDLEGLGTVLNFECVVPRSFGPAPCRGMSQAQGWSGMLLEMRALQVQSLRPGVKLKHRTQQPLQPKRVKRLNAALTAARGVVPAFEIWE